MKCKHCGKEMVKDTIMEHYYNPSDPFGYGERETTVWACECGEVEDYIFEDEENY